MDDERVAVLISRNERLSSRTARLFLYLWDARGRYLTYNGITEHIWNETSAWPSHDALKSLVKRLRRDLEAAGWPVTIKAKYDVGYRLSCPLGWDWEG